MLLLLAHRYELNTAQEIEQRPHKEHEQKTTTARETLVVDNLTSCLGGLKRKRDRV